jgi:hypothetical protein
MVNTSNIAGDSVSTFSEKPILPTSALMTTTGTPALAQEDIPTLPKAPIASHVIDEPRTSGDSTLTMPASSPTSLMDSSELTNSTRATSVSDESDHDKPADGIYAQRRTIVETPVRARDEDEDSESSTPTAPPITGTKHLSTDGKEKEKRHARVSPITIPTDDTNTSETDGETSYDDDLMDELDGAEVQEAFSVSVGKSPITPFFRRGPSAMGVSMPSSPASFVLNGKMTPSPLPSPLPLAYLERAQSYSPSSAGPTPIARTASGSMLSKELVVPEGQEEPTAGGASLRVEETSPEPESNPNFERQPQDDTGINLPPRTSSRSAPNLAKTNVQKEADITPQMKSPIEKSASRKSRMSSATKVFTSKGKSTPNSNPSLSRVSSGTHLSAVPQQQEDAMTVAKRRNLGSGVASKIADLQRNFSKGSSVQSPTAPTSRKSSVISARASSVHDPGSTTPPRSAHSHFRDEHLFRGRAMSKGSMRSLESRDTRTSTPPRNKSSGSIGRLDSRRFSTFNNPAIEVSSKPDTIQVKATIIRTDVQEMDRSPSDATGLGLQHTPTERNHPKIIPTSEPHYAQPRTSVIVEEPRSPTRTSMDKQKRHRARSSISSALGLIGIRPSSPHNSAGHPASPVLSDGRRSARTSLDMSGSLRSLRRRASASLSRSPSVTRETSDARSPSIGRYSTMPLTPMSVGSARSQPEFTRSMSSSSLESSATTDLNGDGSHKRKGSKSRASRMLKRMSNSMSSMLHSGGNESAADRSNAVPTVEEEKWVGADLGEMNVQFPDTLVRALPLTPSTFLSRLLILLRNSSGNAATSK